jgi:hypothetical protein
MTNGLLCQHCGVIYPVVNGSGSGIPNFVVEDLTKSTSPLLRSVSRLDALAKIYESRLWYPLIYHFYGGVFIPSVDEEVKMITEMVDAEGLGTGRRLRNRVIHPIHSTEDVPRLRD